MKGKIFVVGIVVFVLVLSALLFLLNTQRSPRARVFIRSNGSVEPASAPIERNGNTYIFTDNVHAELVVERSDIVIDGAGYILLGPYNGTTENLWIVGNGSDQVTGGTQIPYSIGVDLSGGASGLTLMNLNIKNFSIGTYIWTTDNLFVNNSVSECVVGVLLSGSGNTISGNLMAKNEVGLFFGTNEPGTVPLNLTVSHNSFVSNIRQLGGCLCQESNVSEPIHTWDDGKEGNYWSDYNGSDANGDGIGDMPYVFDVQNEDRYPLMVPQTSIRFEE
jgi:nitrous oxidase accessory protein NosD